jgi:serine/threonine protein kinase
MKKLLPHVSELVGYLPLGAVQDHGPLAAHAVQSLQSGQVRQAEWVELSEITEELFETVRRQWRANSRRQPKGSPKQHELYESDLRLIRVIDTPRGLPLKDWVFTRTFSLDDALQTAISLTACIADWHQMSRLHRWLVGASVYRDASNHVELRDPPIGRIDHEQDLVSLPLWDIAFLSPESSGSLSREIEPAADMYSIGAILFSMLAGRPPIEADNASDYLDRQLCNEPVRLRECGLKVPAALDDVVARLLRRDPRNRYQTASALLLDL